MGGGGGGLIGKVTEPIFGDGGAAAAGRAAMAQQQAAKSAFKEYRNIVNPATVAGLASLDRDIKNQEKSLARQEQLVSSIDPTIMEASQQALRLLRGEASSTLAPVQQQRDQQRQKLLNSLREQLGPGAETSTAGIQALTRFDAETNSLLAGQQQSALAGLGGVAGQFSAVRPDMFREIMGLSSLGQAKGDVSFRQAEGLFKARQPLIGSAGAQHAADVARGQQSAALGGQLLQIGGMALGGGIGGAAAGMLAPSPAAAPAMSSGSRVNDYSVFGSQNAGRYDLL